jgi:rubrerythrin
MQTLESLTDKKDKLKSKLFMKKVETLFETKDNYLHRCVNCNSLFTKKQRAWQVCPNQKAFIDA